MKMKIFNKTSHSQTQQKIKVNETSQNQNHQKTKINETSHRITSGQYGGEKTLTKMKQIAVITSLLT